HHRLDQAAQLDLGRHPGPRVGPDEKVDPGSHGPRRTGGGGVGFGPQSVLRHSLTTHCDRPYTREKAVWPRRTRVWTTDRGALASAALAAAALAAAFTAVARTAAALAAAFAAAARVAAAFLAAALPAAVR